MFGVAESINVYSTFHRKGALGTLTASLSSATTVAASYSSLTNATVSSFTSRIVQPTYQNLRFAERVWLTFPSFSAIPANATVTLAIVDGAKYGSYTMWLDTVVGNPHANFTVSPIVATSSGFVLTLTNIDAGFSAVNATSDPNAVVWTYHTLTNASRFNGITLTVDPTKVYTISYYRPAGAWVAGCSVSAVGGWMIPLS